MNSAIRSEDCVAQHQMRNRALVKKRAQARIIPTEDIVLVRQIEDHAIHVASAMPTKPVVGNRSRKHAGAGSIEIVFLENSAHRIAGDVDVPPRGARSPPIVFRHHDRALRLDRRTKLGTRPAAAFDQNPRPFERRPRLRFPASASRASRAYSLRSIKYQAPIRASASDPGSLASGPSLCSSNARIACRAAFPSRDRCRESIRIKGPPGEPFQRDLQIMRSRQSIRFGFRRPGVQQVVQDRLGRALHPLANHLAQIEVEFVLLFRRSGNHNRAQTRAVGGKKERQKPLSCAS